MIHPADINAEFIGWIPSISVLCDVPTKDSLDAFTVSILQCNGFTNMGYSRDGRHRWQRTAGRLDWFITARGWKDTIRSVCYAHPSRRRAGYPPVGIFIFDRFVIDLPPAGDTLQQLYSFHSPYIPWKPLEKVEDLYAK